jgi:predicted  nucleic acid-binding Zn-ribbon protein
MYTEELDNLYLATKSIEEKAEKMGSKLRKNLELRNQKAHDLEMLNEEMLGIQLMIDEMQSDLNATKERNNELSEELLEDQ